MAPSQEVSAAVGEAPDLDAQIAELEQELAVPSEQEVKQRRLMELKDKKATRVAAALEGQARARLLGIVRALGSLADQSTLDDNKLLESAKAFLDKATVLDERFARCILLRHEAKALAEVFGLELPDLPAVIVPASRKVLSEAFAIVAQAPARDNGYVQPVYQFEEGKPTSRTFDELGDLPGRDLIRRKLGLE